MSIEYRSICNGNREGTGNLLKELDQGNQDGHDFDMRESMKEYIPITQTYFDITKDYIVFCKSGASLDPEEVGEAIGAYPRLSDEVITWLNAYNIPLNLEPGVYCLEQPGNKLRRLED